MALSLPQFSYKGVNYTFVDCQRKFLEELKCSICLELVPDPVQTSSGSLLCRQCIEEAKTRSVDCKNLTTTPDHFNRNRRLGDFKVKCPNSAKGCSWLGELRAAEEHTNEICLHRNFKCPHCPHRGTYSTVTTTHLTVCESFRLPCVAGCKQSLTREEMKTHLEKTCSEELVACPHKMAGCTSVVKRKDLEGHLLDKDHHLQVLMESYASSMQQLYGIIQRGLSPDVCSIPLAFCPWLLNTPTCYPRPPWVIKMEGFQEKKEKNEQWFGDPVYSHFGGYKMCLNVDANGDNYGKGTHVSVYVYLMRGDNDDNLKWPFKGIIRVSLLNQLEYWQHHTMELWSPDDDVSKDTSGRVAEGERADSGWGHEQFISHKKLNCRSNKKCQYLKDDTIFFRVDYFGPKLD